MRVTRFNYALEDSLVEKCKKIADRVTRDTKKKDAVILIEGPEGSGKTTMSIAMAYYISELTGRKFNHEQIFFDAEKLIHHLQNTDNQIVIWDEPSLSALTGDFATKTTKNVTRLMMMMRKKRHVVFMNITYFHRFFNYAVTDRAAAMIHIYERKSTGQYRFIWIPGKKLGNLYEDYLKKRKKNYWKYANKLCRGAFPNILDDKYKYNVLSEFDVGAYESNKDAGIQKVGEKVHEKIKEKTDKLREKYETQLVKSLTNLQKELKLTEDNMCKMAQLPRSSWFDIKTRIFNNKNNDLKGDVSVLPIAEP